MSSISPIVQTVESDPNLLMNDDHFVNHKYRRDDHSTSRFKLRRLAYLDLIHVLEHFEKYQIESKWLHKWSVTALSRYIRVHIFDNEMNWKTSRDIALLIMQISNMRHVL